MKKLLAISLFGLTLAVGSTGVMAAGPVGLTDAQLDTVDAGARNKKRRGKRGGKKRQPSAHAEGGIHVTSGYSSASAGGSASASGRGARADVISSGGAIDVEFGPLYIGAATASNHSSASTGGGKGGFGGVPVANF